MPQKGNNRPSYLPFTFLFLRLLHLLWRGVHIRVGEGSGARIVSQCDLIGIRLSVSWRHVAEAFGECRNTGIIQSRESSFNHSIAVKHHLFV